MANSSYYTSGGNSGKNWSKEERQTSEPLIDKNPIYKTNDTFRRAYKKNITLLAGDQNQTDCTSTIWVKFCDPIEQRIVQTLPDDGSGEKYLLECGHVWSGSSLRSSASKMCYPCGNEQGYLGFEHEWQHILFKTDPAMARLFISSWVRELHAKAPHVDKKELEKFLFLVLNAFDDIRCNSLWELIYAGSADRIWKRWTRLSNSIGIEGNSTNFVAFLFAVALGTPTDKNGDFECMRPMIEWGMQNVRRKGYQRALAISKLSLDWCIQKLLERTSPPPPPEPQQQQDPQQQGGGSGGQDGGEPQKADDGGQQNQPQQQSNQGAGTPSQTDASNAVSALMQEAKEFDEKEKHTEDASATSRPLSDAEQAAVRKALHVDASDQGTFDDLTDDGTDADMQNAIDQFKDGITTLTPDSQLMSDAKSRILFIDVLPHHINNSSKIQLSDVERSAVARMRAIFYRTLGRQKAHREAGGSQVDIDAAIQHLVNPIDPEIFEVTKNNQGFSYMVLCDMSGSMHGARFSQVCKAVEMLKHSLKFPFVNGSMWGFRGSGDSKYGGSYAKKDAWLYRYDSACDGYVGSAPARGASKGHHYPVGCGGLTPMHTAVRVAIRHMINNVSGSVAKRLFLLTDGSPVARKMSGDGLPGWLLQQYVAKEIAVARQKGIQVFTLVVDGGLSAEESTKMFGPPRYWREVDSSDPNNSIDRVLQNLILHNFDKYLKTR